MSNKKNESVTPTYTKPQLLESKTYRNKHDLLTALLNNDRVYSLKEVDAEIEKYMKGKVK